MAKKRTTDRDEEEEYFHKEDEQKKATLRRDRQLQAVRQKEREAIAEELDTSEEVAEEAMALGFDAETARVLPLIPLIQVAWGNGRVSRAESEKVNKKAAEFGLTQGSPACNFLNLLLEEKPTDLFFERANKVMSHIVEEDRTGMGDNVLAWSKAVAEASGGFFGLANPIKKGQQEVLEELAELLGIDS